MSTINCDSCANLRESAPEFVQNGVTDKVAASLKNNTGLNPSLTVLHNDCEDLNDVNDCLIGRMADEVEAYDVCEWKEFMKKHLSNLYETLKAIIAAICGLWVKVESICAITKQLITPSVRPIGVYSPDYNREHGTSDVGHIYEKNGVPVVRPYSRAEIDPDHIRTYDPCCGINFSVQDITDCETGKEVYFVRYSPKVYIYKTTAALVVGDVVWYATRSELKSALGNAVGDAFMNSFISETPFRHSTAGVGFWGGTYTAANRKRWWWTFYVDIDGQVLGTGEDTLYYIYAGTDLPDPNAAPGADVRIHGNGIADMITVVLPKQEV